MILNDEKLDSIVVTIIAKNPDAQLVTADDDQEVIAIIADDNISVKNGYEIKLIPVES